MQTACDELWGRVSVELSARLSEEVFSRWIRVIRPCRLDADHLQLSVANDFYVFWLEEN